MHTCHAEGCKQPVPPRLFMCRTHWAALEQPMRDAIWREYRPGQETDKRPSLRYMTVAAYAIARVAFKPNDEEAGVLVSRWLLLAEIGRAESIAAGVGDPLVGIAPTPPMMTIEQARTIKAKFEQLPEVH